MNNIRTSFLVILLCLSIFSVVLPQVTAGPVPSISVITSTDKTNVQIGDVVTYSFEVINTGKVTLFGVEVDGTLTGVATKQTESGRTNDKLESGESWVFSDTYLVQEGDSDPLVNIVTATAYTRKGVAYSQTDVFNVYLFGTAGDVLPEVLTSPNQEPSGGWYGTSVAIGEGVIVVGAPYESIPNPLYDPTLRKQTEPSQIYGAGRVYIYSATTGALLDTITSPSATAPGWFGYSVAVGDGVIVVGAPKETSGEVTLAGNVHVYDAETFAYIATLTTPNPVSNGDGQGYGVSVAVNEGIIAVGSSREADDGYAAAGKVYLYNAADMTALTFSPLTSEHPKTYGRFGSSVAVGEGVIVVAAPYEDTDSYEGAGRVYTYVVTTGELIDVLVSLNEEKFGNFGFSVAVGSGKIVIGAFRETVSGDDDAGRAYIYDLVSKTIVYTLVSQNSQYRGMFGHSVAVGADVVVVGALLEDSGSYTSAGSAYLFDAITGADVETLTNPSPADWTEFGWSVAVNDTNGVVAVGAYDAVFIFE